MSGWFIWDVETRIAIDRVLRTEKPLAQHGCTEGKKVAVKEVLDRICAEKGQTADRPCFIPARFHEPVALVGLLLTEELEYRHHMVLAPQLPDGEPDVQKVTQEFWASINWLGANGRPRLVTFNGGHFDIPVMEVAALEHGCSLAGWLNPEAKVWEDPRGDRAPELHWDLYSILAKAGMLGGGLNFWSRLAGYPGKLDTGGDMVQQMLDEKKLAEIADYCVTDVLNTYGLLWHVLTAMGRMAPRQNSPVFENTLRKVAAGRGPEVQRYLGHLVPPF